MKYIIAFAAEKALSDRKALLSPILKEFMFFPFGHKLILLKVVYLMSNTRNCITLLVLRLI